MKLKGWILLGICAVLAGIGYVAWQTGNKRPTLPIKGINIGNALDSPKDISWGVDMQSHYFNDIQTAGFDTVRLPVRFSDYVDANYVLDEGFMTELDGYIQHALDLDLTLILDFHHFVELMGAEERDAGCDFAYYQDMYYAIWKQLGERYKDYPDGLVFELLNEPIGDVTSDIWNEMIAKSLADIRETNPERLVIVCPTLYASVGGLETLELPKDDNIMVTVHYYAPLEFAFQNDENHAGFESAEPIAFIGNEAELEYMEQELGIVYDYALAHDVHVLVGEFGAVKTAPEESRIVWTQAVVDICEKYGFAYAYWELGHNFGIYDLETGQWNEALLDVLVNGTESR